MNEPDLHETRTWSVMACLGVSSRFRLVRALAVADRCVGELAEAVGLSQSCTTRHLQALERVGLVRGHREGRRVRFRLRAEAPGLRELLGWALSGEGRDAPAAPGGVRRDQDAVPPVPAKADLPVRSTFAARPRGKVDHAPIVDFESGGPVDPGEPGERNPQAVVRSTRTRRTDDLEDYLL